LQKGAPLVVTPRVNSRNALKVNQLRTAAVEPMEEPPMISKPTDIETNPDEARRRAVAINRHLRNTPHPLAGAGIDLLVRHYLSR
jgi:hypothetical protein